MKKNQLLFLLAICFAAVQGFSQNTNKLVKYTSTGTTTGPSSLIETITNTVPRLGFPNVTNTAGSYFEIRRITPTTYVAGSLLKLNEDFSTSQNSPNFIDFFYTDLGIKYGIFQSSASIRNYFAGSMGIGELPNYNYMLNVKGDLLCAGLVLNGSSGGHIHSATNSLHMSITTATQSAIKLEIFEQYSKFYNDVTIETLRNTGNKVLTTDASGKLTLVAPGVGYGDNMGNCEATQNLKMFDYSIFNGAQGDKLMERTDGSRYNPGLRFSADNSMILETGQSARLALVSGTNTPSAVWVSNWSSGGYGLVLNENNSTGGIYRDANNPAVAIGFNRTTVGIGIIPPDETEYALYVAGGILATEVKVQLQSDWKDLVFLPDYKLRTIKEVETYISENGHLPEIPNSETVKNEGINIGEMNALLLQKIEELTLYIIDQQKQLDEQQKQIKTITNNLSK